MGNCGFCSAGQHIPDGAAENDSEASLEQQQRVKLNRLTRARPYLHKEHHGLNQYVAEAQEELAAGNANCAENAILTLELGIAAEEHAIAAAFQKFDHSGDGVLQGDEIKFMLDYLGFPCDDKDVADLMARVDTDADDTVSFDEFIAYVGAIGGSGKLFELRRSQIEGRRQSQSGGGMDKETLRAELLEAGIQEDAVTYWQLTASPTELEEAAMLKPCQKEAVRHIRSLAKENHTKALPGLIERAKKLGFSEVDLHMALAWVRELAPLIIHIKLDKLGDLFAKDNHYRNQFETNTSSGLLKTSARIKWERNLFGKAYEPATTEAFDRPKYGVQNIWNDPRGVVGCAQYGDSYLVLKDVRLRCTMSPEDSANLPAKRLAVPDYYAHVFNEYTDKELLETLRVAKGGDEQLGDSQSVIEKWGKYKEVQIHGPVDLKRHVERLVVHERHRRDKDWVESIAAEHGWKVTFVSDMVKELKGRASGQEMDQSTWQSTLQDKLQYLGAEQERAQRASAFVRKKSMVCPQESRAVQWSFETRDGWQQFDKSCQEPLETMYTRYKETGSPRQTELENPRAQKTILVDFDQMFQQVKGNERRRKIRRAPIG
jgi:hypothetical protein